MLDHLKSSIGDASLIMLYTGDMNNSTDVKISAYRSKPKVKTNGASPSQLYLSMKFQQKGKKEVLYSDEYEHVYKIPGAAIPRLELKFEE